MPTAIMGVQGKAVEFDRSLVFHTESLLFVVGLVGDGVDEGVGVGGMGMGDPVARGEFPRTHFGRGCPRAGGKCYEGCCSFSPGLLSGRLEPVES